MFDHVGLGVGNIEASREFLLRALQPLGVQLAMDGPNSVGLGVAGKPSLWLYATQAVSPPLHLAFTAGTRAAVDDFYHAAIAAGARDNGPPGLRPHYHANYYAAFVIGPDGHNLEAVCHLPQA